jgi:F-type H+-transporting ATPase subunit delta
MKELRAADRYARSIFEIAEEKEQGETVVRELETLSEALVKQPRFLAILNNPMVKRDEKRSLIHKAIGAKASPLVERFLALLIRKGRIELFGDIVERLHDLLNKRKGIQEVTITSARKMDPTTAGALKATLEKLTGGSILIDAAVDPRLLGGAQVRLGNRLVDGSLRTKLDALESRLRILRV